MTDRMTDIKLKECECGNNTFLIEERNSCENCIYNGAWDPETWERGDGKYIYDEGKIKEKCLKRDQVENEGECKLGYTAGEGCLIIKCSRCGKIVDHVPWVSC